MMIDKRTWSLPLSFWPNAYKHTDGKFYMIHDKLFVNGKRVGWTYVNGPDTLCVYLEPFEDGEDV